MFRKDTDSLQGKNKFKNKKIKKTQKIKKLKKKRKGTRTVNRYHIRTNHF